MLGFAGVISPLNTGDVLSFSVNVNVSISVKFPLSVTCTVMLNTPFTAGVKLINPVKLSMLNPASAGETLALNISVSFASTSVAFMSYVNSIPASPVWFVIWLCRVETCQRVYQSQTACSVNICKSGFC